MKKGFFDYWGAIVTALPSPIERFIRLGLFIFMAASKMLVTRRYNCLTL